MKKIESVIPQVLRHEVYFASQHSIQHLCEIVAQKDFAIVPSRKMSSLLSAIEPNALDDWTEFQRSWGRLEQNTFMRDGGSYRFRRHVTYSAAPGSTCPTLEAHQPHYQSLDYNTLNGDIARHFATIEPGISQNKVLTAALELYCTLFGRLAPYYGWHIEVHQFRIGASQAVFLPTPEGVHGVAPIIHLDPLQPAFRDVLVIIFRKR